MNYHLLSAENYTESADMCAPIREVFGDRSLLVYLEPLVREEAFCNKVIFLNR